MCFDTQKHGLGTNPAPGLSQVIGLSRVMKRRTVSEHADGSTMGEGQDVIGVSGLSQLSNGGVKKLVQA